MENNSKIVVSFETNAGIISEEIEKLGEVIKKLVKENSCEWWQFWKWFQRTRIVIKFDNLISQK